VPLARPRGTNNDGIGLTKNERGAVQCGLGARASAASASSSKCRMTSASLRTSLTPPAVCPAQCALAELRAIRGVLEAAVRYALDL